MSAFLSDPSPIIGYPFSDWLTKWQTDCCLVDLVDVFLAFEDPNSKLLEVDSVADVDDKECFDNTLVEILNQNICQDIEV